MSQSFSERTARLIGDEGVALLQSKHVLIAGLGGVGSYVAEALCRAGIGAFTLIDPDRIEITNLNRQLFALHSTLGHLKTDVAAARLADINPEVSCQTLPIKLEAEKLDAQGLEQVDYVVDCIDDVQAKTALIHAAARQGIPVIASMGTGNRLDNTAFEIADISATSHCPLARAMRTSLRKRGLDRGVKVVFSRSQAFVAPLDPRIPGTISVVPGACGLILAGEVIRDFLEELPIG